MQKKEHGVHLTLVTFPHTQSCSGKHAPHVPRWAGGGGWQGEITSGGQTYRASPARILRPRPPPSVCSPGNRISQHVSWRLFRQGQIHLRNNHRVRDTVGSSSRRQGCRGMASALLPPRRKVSCVSGPPSGPTSLAEAREGELSWVPSWKGRRWPRFM